MFENKVKTIWAIIITVTFSIIISNNIKSILNYQKGVKKIEKVEKQLAKLEKENQNLKENIEQTGNPDYIQKLAVEELNLTQEGSTILIIPEEKQLTSPAEERSHSNTAGSKNFDKWLLFLKLR